MKPLYQLTPISDHAKELLAAIDIAKEPLPPFEPKASTDRGLVEVKDLNRDYKHETFSMLHGEKHKGEPAYTEGQVKGLESMYGVNGSRLRSNTQIKFYRNASLMLSNEKVDAMEGILFDNCIIEFNNQDLAGKLYQQGCRFNSCYIIYSLNSEKVEYKLTRN